MGPAAPLPSRLLGAKICGQMGAKHCQGVSLASGNPGVPGQHHGAQADCGKPDTLPVPASRDLVPAGGGNAEYFLFPYL